MCCAALRTIGTAWVKRKGILLLPKHSYNTKRRQCGHPELDSIEHEVYVADFSEMN